MPHSGDKGVAAWTRRWWRPLLAELVATALLVWLGCGACLHYAHQQPPLTHPALAFGFLVVGNAQAFGPTSGAHMNPAVTLAALLQGRLGAAAAAGYALMQLAGAVLGFGALLLVSPASATAAPVGCTVLATDVAPLAAAAVEAALTGLLVVAISSAWTQEDAGVVDHTVPLKIGTLVAGLIYAGGPATGASLNPARSFGPALLLSHWDHHWVYWAGPLLGSVLGTLLHRTLRQPRHAPRATSGTEDVPLNDKP